MSRNAWLLALVVAAPGLASAQSGVQPINFTIPFTPVPPQDVEKRVQDIGAAIQKSIADRSKPSPFKSVKMDGTRLVMHLADADSPSELEGTKSSLARRFCEAPYSLNGFPHLVLIGAELEFHQSLPNNKGHVQATMNQANCRPKPPSLETLQKFAELENKGAAGMDVDRSNGDMTVQAVAGGLLLSFRGTQAWGARMASFTPEVREQRLRQAAAGLCKGPALQALIAAGTQVTYRYGTDDARYGEIRCGPAP